MTWEIIHLVIFSFVGFLVGLFFGRKMISPQIIPDSGLLGNIGAQIAEMKTKFGEIEKSRDLSNKEKEKLETEKTKRFEDYMGHTNKIFKEIADKGEKSDEQKEKRIMEYMDSTKKFFNEQKETSEKFLEHQGKSREEMEKSRDAQIKDMAALIESFTRTVSGTKRRGMVGEDILSEILSNSIKAGIVKKNLKTENGEVEFGWKLSDGKYIPIDCKMPDIFKLVDKYHETDSTEEQREIVKKIINKIKKELKTVQKYQNLTNTINNCMLVVPPAVIEMAPEVVSLGKDENVFVCTYKDVFPIAHVLEEQYARMHDEGDIGEYKHLVKSLFQILDKINKRTETFDRAITTIKNANEEIKDEIAKGNRKKV
jgi:DNA recombination protein RmuC